ncbi:5-oxopent-3-ene-1,2,5-tricarboxylate decarboxylase/2-hydroxyhepta-2,4-diene-1,7-dioate isomerase [Azospirillum agricola]|uniref:fumarylacetoacetate hydrolase family protein n=1 Tax=Azospirillum agricola TaxID=1720247 RepID=UPI001AE8C7BA|nr:fumarylacetoacetate hydrolase family protein [Azospirillum agricola]MBP2232444.1 5-oxopent-3-ene-1,2,5-tricarboxylate decarboxylase/2-hydroxyhepta-2,4-diene-1,7-dioate isomerase [Azospirillum agricola]
MHTTSPQGMTQGMVYGVILNDRRTLDRLGPALSQPPYSAPPKAPVLYIKPYNTHAGNGAAVRLPRGAERVEVAATLGLVIGRDATALDEATAMDAVAGLRPILDVSLPNPSVYRPPVRERCFDGSCPMGGTLPYVAGVEALTLRTLVNGTVVAERSLSDLVRPPARLLAEVTGFMTLRAGDTLHLGIALDGPQAGADDRVRLEIDGFAPLDIVIEDAAAEGETP